MKCLEVLLTVALLTTAFGCESGSDDSGSSSAAIGPSEPEVLDTSVQEGTVSGPEGGFAYTVSNVAWNRVGIEKGGTSSYFYDLSYSFDVTNPTSEDGYAFVSMKPFAGARDFGGSDSLGVYLEAGQTVNVEDTYSLWLIGEEPPPNYIDNVVIAGVSELLSIGTPILEVLKPATAKGGFVVITEINNTGDTAYGVVLSLAGRSRSGAVQERLDVEVKQVETGIKPFNARFSIDHILSTGIRTMDYSLTWAGMDTDPISGTVEVK